MTPTRILVSRGTVIAIGAALALGAGGLAMWRHVTSNKPTRLISANPPARTYVGSQTCAECHAIEATKWRASQHAGAMAIASDQTVLGRFDGRGITYAGLTTTFFRRDGKYYVRTDGSDGQIADFEIKYTFGISPLQQYLIPQSDNRLQALTIAWDTRPASSGGQRWFHLYPNEAIKPGDPLHWTGLRQNWNFMCADCHATNLRKGFDAATHQFHTSWSELGVGCEACHGPGSEHRARARDGNSVLRAAGLTAQLDERRGVQWAIDATTALPRRSQPRTTNREIEVCARCHSRRSQLTDDAPAGAPFENAFRPSVLEPSLFYADGQQKEEVYNYASFLQSRMYAKGVTCSDCHDPHSGQLKLAGNATCTACHQSATYDATSHHFHSPGSQAAGCVTCHMPPATFMVIDRRHDHSFRVPRPDRTGSLGVPNICTGSCHRDKGPAWAAQKIQQRAGRAPDGYQTFTEAFAAADRGARGAFAELLKIAADPDQPAIVRGGALERLSTSAVADPGLSDNTLGDPNPMVRRLAVAAFAHADERTRLRLIPRLLSDSIRTVRIQAAMCLADLADTSLTGPDRTAFDRAFDEFVAEQRFNADRPEAQTNLGQILVQRTRIDAAVAAFREAVRLDRTFIPAYINLADAYRVQGNEPSAERALREAIAIVPASAPARHALGLTLVRQHRLAEAIPELARAATLEPETARYSYVHAVALHDTGNSDQAIKVLEASVQRHPDDRDSLLALSTYLEGAGRVRDAGRYVDRLLTIDPNDAEARDLARRMQVR